MFVSIEEAIPMLHLARLFDEVKKGLYVEETPSYAELLAYEEELDA